MVPGDATTLATVTSLTLLEELRDPANRTVWADFVGRYRLPIVRFAKRSGLTEVEAEDAAQETLMAFATAYVAGKYDRERGRLRHWLFGIAARQVKRALTKRNPREIQVSGLPGEGDSRAVPPDEHRFEDMWDEAWRDAVYQQCLAEVRATFAPKTVTAFELFAAKGWPARRVAEHLGMTENAVFLAKHKILQRIREIRPLMEEIW